VAAVGAALIFVGLYLCVESYKAIHAGNTAAATPLTTASTALKGS